MSAACIERKSLVLVLMIVCSAGADAQSQCKLTEQPLGGVQGMPAVVHHECPGASSGNETLSVTFARLNEVIISNILMNVSKCCNLASPRSH